MSALTDLLFGVPANISDEYGNEIILGPISSESENYSSQVTSHAIEDGSTINDHVHVDQPNFSISTFLSDQNDLAAKATSLLFGSDLNVTAKIEFLKYWQGAGELLTYSGPVFSGLFSDGYDMVAENVIISKIGISRSASNGSGVEVSLTFNRVEIAYTQVTSLNIKNSPRSIKTTAAKGKTAKGTAATGAAPKQTSWLGQMTGYFG